MLIGNTLNGCAPLRSGDKTHVKNTAPLTCLFICTPKISFCFSQILGSVSHTITTNSQLHHHCTSAFQSKSWCWCLCTHTNTAWFGALQRGTLRSPALPSTHTEELPIPACIYLIHSGGQLSWLGTFILASLLFSTKPPRSCNSPYKLTIIVEISSYRQQVEAHKYHPYNTHSKWVHQKTGCGKSKAITHTKPEPTAANWWTIYIKRGKNNFQAIQSVLQFHLKERNLKKRRKKKKPTQKSPIRFTPFR